MIFDELLWIGVSFLHILLCSCFNSSELNLESDCIVTLDSAVKNGFLEFRRDGCLSSTAAAKQSKNAWIDGARLDQQHAVKLTGTTYWINDFMAVGHMMYDIGLLQLISSVHVDRIILQRAPCATSDLCLGVGTYNSFFRGFYDILLKASINPNIELLMRFQANEKTWKRMLPTNGESQIFVSDNVCSGVMIRRVCNKCFHHSICQSSANKFKNIAHDTLLNDTLGPSSSSMIKQQQQQVVITLAHRGKAHHRDMTDPRALLTILQQQLEHLSCNVTFDDSSISISSKISHSNNHGNNITCASKIKSIKLHLFDTSNLHDTVEQLHTSYWSDVIISTHGAFQSNSVFMRPQSLWIELRGASIALEQAEGANFAALARLFGVHHRVVQVRALRDHVQHSYALDQLEIQQIVIIVKEYLQYKQQIELLS